MNEIDGLRQANAQLRDALVNACTAVERYEKMILGNATPHHSLELRIENLFERFLNERDEAAKRVADCIAASSPFADCLEPTILHQTRNGPARLRVVVKDEDEEFSCTVEALITNAMGVDTWIPADIHHTRQALFAALLKAYGDPQPKSEQRIPF